MARRARPDASGSAIQPATPPAANAPLIRRPTRTPELPSVRDCHRLQIPEPWPEPQPEPAATCPAQCHQRLPGLAPGRGRAIRLRQPPASGSRRQLPGRLTPEGRLPANSGSAASPAIPRRGASALSARLVHTKRCLLFRPSGARAARGTGAARPTSRPRARRAASRSARQQPTERPALPSGCALPAHRADRRRSLSPLCPAIALSAVLTAAGLDAGRVR